MDLTSKSNIAFTNRYLTVNGQPWFPVMGEIHYSRVAAHRWETELLKMKAGGVDVVSAYSIWIHHEEIENEWDFTGNKNLRLFLQTIKKCGMYCVLRIGPWAHGEVRNGGFPDWLVEKEREGSAKLRTNDPAYLAQAEIFYKKIYEQAAGLFIKDDGPIIGIQIENEYGHCGGLTGDAGEAHMKTLLEMAKQIGFDVPLYTATGWGGAVTGGMLPVMGGYCEAPWDQRHTEIEPSGNYIFTQERNDHNIGSDHGIGQGITFDMSKFPYLTAELGGGLQVTKHRRPIATAKDTAVMSMVKIGSGCNLLGYYMYHGGTNPEGKRTTLQESRATGYLNDLPVLSYDFNAPIREYGQLTDTYRALRALTMFVKDYQDILCRTEYIPQPGNPDKPENAKDVRSAVRAAASETNDGAALYGGFYFVNNYQRRYRQAEHEGFAPAARLSDGEAAAVYDVMDLHDGDAFFRPFNLKIGDGILKTTNAVPLCILNEQVYVFYVPAGVAPDYRIKGNLGKASILTLTEEEAMHASKITLEGRDYLVISDGDVLMNVKDEPELILEVSDHKTPAFRVWPEMPHPVKGFKKISSAGKMYRMASTGIFAVYVYEHAVSNMAEVEPVTEAGGGHTDLHAQIVVENKPLSDMQAGLTVDEVLLKAAYTGDTAEVRMHGRLTADNFYTGQVWEIGVYDRLKENRAQLDMTIHPLSASQKESLYLQEWPEMADGSACSLDGLSTSTIYRLKLV